MTLMTIILQILLTIPLTIILNYYQKEDNRRINHVLIPTIYIILVAAFFPTVKENIFLIVIFEIFIRNFYVTNVINRQNESGPISFILENIISIALSLFIYNYFISKVETVIPNPENIKEFIWFLIIIYIVYLYNLKSKHKQQEQQNVSKKIKSERIIMQYAKFKNKYSSLIKSKNILINNIIYAIMIYEDYHNPKIYRRIKEYIGIVTKKETKYGIMQIKSFERLTDEDSIKRVATEYEKILKNTKLKENDKIEKLLSNYTLEERKNIIHIYQEIVEFSKK